MTKNKESLLVAHEDSHMEDDSLSSHISTQDSASAVYPYPGMNKEDLMKFADTPFWNTLRRTCLFLLWGSWLATLIAIIALTVSLPRCTAPSSNTWWQKAQFYQVYVRSFYDSDGDGIGDIKGVTSKLDYIAELGSDALVLSAFYKHASSNASFEDRSFEIIDHKNIDPEYGTMADVQALIAQAKEEGLRVILDFIPNHTSIDHPWFHHSINKHVDFNDFYVWQNCTRENPPNNWINNEGQSAWTYNSIRKQCYLHQFKASQPDLNLRNPRVLEELTDVLRFWQQKDIDGFRILQAEYLYEDESFDDEPYKQKCDWLTDNCMQHIYTKNQPENFKLIGQWWKMLDEESELNKRILVAEAYGSDNLLMAYYGKEENKRADLVPNYGIPLKCTNQSEVTMCIFKIVENWLALDPDQSSWITSNFELQRWLTILGEDYARAINTISLGLPGASWIFYGEEIGMIDSQNITQNAQLTPMQWSDNLYGGFINLSAMTHNSTPWMDVNTNSFQINVKNQIDRPESTLENFKEVSYLRHNFSALGIEGQLAHAIINENIYSFIRWQPNGERVLFTANLGQEVSTDDYTAAFDSTTVVPKEAQLLFLFSTDDNHYMSNVQSLVSLETLTLEPAEAAIFYWK